MTEPLDVNEAAPASLRVRLWDGPTRLFHWSLVVLLCFSWWSAEAEEMTWHRWSGYAVMGLLVFRLYWGVLGSQTARFTSFLKGPRDTLAYARTLGVRAPSKTLGHNPIGAISVVVILLVLLAQVLFGLFAVDIDGLESGPLSTYVDFDDGRRFAHWHKWSFTALQALAATHIAAVAFYLVYKHDNLIAPMITGRKRVAADPGLRFATWPTLAIGVVAAVAVAWFVANGLKAPIG